MKSPTKLLSAVLLFSVAVFTLYSCGKNNDSTPVPRKATYNFTAFGEHNITGTALFKEIVNTDSVAVTVTLKGNEINDLVSLPVKIRQGTSIEDGEILYELGNYDGSKQVLEKSIKLSYDDLKDLNGSIGVYDNNGNILSQAEIGSNATYKSFTMTDPRNDKMNGQFRIYKRGTGSYLVIKVTPEGLATACQGADHPAKVIDADGIPDPDFTLNPVADSNGVSATALSDKDYNDLIKYQGSIKVFCSESVLVTTISQGNF